LLPLLAHHPQSHHSCRCCHHPLYRTPLLLPTPSFSSSPLPSLLTATLIANIMALSTLALFVTTIIIRRTLLSFIVAHRRDPVVTSSTLFCQQPSAFANLVAG
jgi:hypothetical protein